MSKRRIAVSLGWNSSSRKKQCQRTGLSAVWALACSMNFDLWLVRVAVESRNFGVVEAIAKAQSPKPQQLISDRRPHY
jgi:hypothetical protein